MTAVPAVIDALLAALRVAPGLVGVRVIDGPWLDRPSEPDVIVVGWTPDEGPAVDQVDTGGGLDSTRQSFDLVNLASAWRGGTDMKTARDRADQLIEAVRGELTRDPTIGGAASWARLSTLSLSQYQTSGSEVAVEFAIRVTAFRLD